MLQIHNGIIKYFHERMITTGYYGRQYVDYDMLIVKHPLKADQLEKSACPER